MEVKMLPSYWSGLRSPLPLWLPLAFWGAFIKCQSDSRIKYLFSSSWLLLSSKKQSSWSEMPSLQGSSPTWDQEVMWICVLSLRTRLTTSEATTSPTSRAKGQLMYWCLHKLISNVCFYSKNFRFYFCIEFYIDDFTLHLCYRPFNIVEHSFVMPIKLCNFYPI